MHRLVRKLLWRPEPVRRPVERTFLHRLAMFTLVAFTVAEVPLVCYLATPTKTLAVVQRLNDWMNERRHTIPAVVVGACGLLLVATAIGKV